ncbi:MAG TPA: HAMP domain-containing sensor histidine kinase, partial [Polyangiaceae bacterium]
GSLPLRVGWVKITDLAMEMLDVFASQARANDVDLTMTNASDLPALFVCDGQKVSWALATLVGNAIRYAQGAALTSAPHVDVHVAWDLDEEELVLRVSDNGPGMTSARASALFEPDAKSGRTAGLALVMVRDVVVAHGGHVEVDSRIGHGTTITMRLPKIEPPLQ